MLARHLSRLALVILALAQFTFGTVLMACASAQATSAAAAGHAGHEAAPSGRVMTMAMPIDSCAGDACGPTDPASECAERVLCATPPALPAQDSVLPCPTDCTDTPLGGTSALRSLDRDIPDPPPKA